MYRRMRACVGECVLLLIPRSFRILDFDFNEAFHSSDSSYSGYVVKYVPQELQIVRIERIVRNDISINLDSITHFRRVFFFRGKKMDLTQDNCVLKQKSQREIPSEMRKKGKERGIERETEIRVMSR